MKRVLIVTFTLILLCSSSGCSPALQGEQYRPAQKITVNGIELSNLSRLEAEAKLRPELERMLNKEISLTHKDREFRLPLKELGVGANLDEVLDRIYGDGIKAPVVKEDSAHRLELVFDKQQAEDKLVQLAAELDAQPQDAVLKAKNDNTAEIVPHSTGVQVDVPEAVQKLREVVSNHGEKVVLVVREVQPKIKVADLQAQKFDTLLSSFSTTFSANEKNRTENLTKAAQALDMTLLQPGELLSFNQKVGPRTEGTGYKEAPVIVQNELVPGIGGGVCQVSSTLYNSVLLADLEIVERHPHEFAVAYLPPGRDATVVDGSADLKFKNNTPGYMLIRSEVKGSELKISVFGKANNKKVELKTVIEESKSFGTERRFDTSLAPGKVIQDQAGVKGYSTRTYRIVKVNNQEVKQEEVSKDRYKPANRIYRVGPSRGDWE